MTTNSITLIAAVQRILQSTATNEGPDARYQLCALDAEPARLSDLFAQLNDDWHQPLAVAPDRAPISRYHDVRIERKLKNWQIVEAATGTPLLRQHPWDDSANVAFLGTRPDPAHIESLVQFSGRVQALANEAERLRQFVIAKNLWEMVAVINDYTKQPTMNAIQESLRLARVLTQLTGKPVQTGPAAM